MFDENGQEIKIEPKDVHTAEEEGVIYFAELDDSLCGKLKHTTKWNMNEENNGAFFIYSKDDSIDGEWLNLVNNESGLIVWQSKITKLPKNTISVGEIGKKANYITRKALYKGNLAGSDGVYIAKIENRDNSMLVLELIEEDSICEVECKNNYTNKEECKEEIMVSEDNNNSELKEDYDEYGRLIVRDKNVLQDEDNIEYEEVKEEEVEAYEEVKEEEVEVYEVVKEEEVEEESDGVPFSGNIPFDEILEVENTDEEIEEKFSLKSYILSNYIDMKNVSLAITDFEEATDKIDGDVIIEKLKNTYSVIVKGFGSKKITLVEGEKPYYEFNYGIDLFIKKVNTILKNMFGYNDDELSTLKKVIISDEVYENNENISVILRKEAIKKLADKGQNLIYINEEGSYINAISEGRRFEVYKKEYLDLNYLLIKAEEEKELEVIIISDVDPTAKPVELIKKII